MTYVPSTPLGSIEDFIPRVAEYAMEAAGIQAVTAVDTGISGSTSVTGDAVAAVTETSAALIALMLANTTDPKVTPFLLNLRDRLGL